MPTPNCHFCDAPLAAYAESTFKGQTAIVARCPTGGDYAITPEGVEALAKLTDAEKSEIHENLVMNTEFGGERIVVSRVFMEGIIGRGLLE